MYFGLLDQNDFDKSFDRIKWDYTSNASPFRPATKHERVTTLHAQSIHKSCRWRATTCCSIWPYSKRWRDFHVSPLPTTPLTWATQWRLSALKFARHFCAELTLEQDWKDWRRTAIALKALSRPVSAAWSLPADVKSKYDSNLVVITENNGSGGCLIDRGNGNAEVMVH